MTSVGDWEFIDIRSVHRWVPDCEQDGHDVGVGWRINRDGQRRLQGWCFTCDSNGVGIKKDRPKSEWPDDIHSVPVVRDNRPPCGGGRRGAFCDPFWVPSSKHGIWYRACKDCGTITATDKSWEPPEALAVLLGEAENIDTLERLVWDGQPHWLVRLAISAMCQRCGATEDQQTLHRHHWGVRALFPDAEEWPTSVLCQPCHSRWHSTVTPNLRRSPIVKARDALRGIG